MSFLTWRRLLVAAIALACAQVALLAALWLAPEPPAALPVAVPEPQAPAAPEPGSEPAATPGYSARDLCRLDTLLAARLEQEALRRGVPAGQLLPEASLRAGVCPPGEEVPPTAGALLAAYETAFQAAGLGALPGLGDYQ